MMKNYRLYHDDCLKILETIPENTFDMIFADPPYMLSNGGITCQNGKVVSVNKGKWDESQGFEQDFEFPMIALVVSGGHTELLVMNDDYQFEQSISI